MFRFKKTDRCRLYLEHTEFAESYKNVLEHPFCANDFNLGHANDHRSSRQDFADMVCYDFYQDIVFQMGKPVCLPFRLFKKF